MLQLLSPKVWSDISAAASGAKQPSHVAVAYFSAKGHQLLPLRPGSILVVDASIPTVSAGATSPASLLKLANAGVEVYSAIGLHAKAYAFDDLGFVGSPNASSSSAHALLESVLVTDDGATLASIRTLVQSLAITRLDENDLKDLETFYRPPKKPSYPKKQAQYATLLMELTKEQGAGRETQVQPPKAVWETFFGMRFSLGALPMISVTHLDDPLPVPISRRVVKHHHNFTLEFPAAHPPRPAILWVRRVGPRAFEYRVLRPGSARFNSSRMLLDNVHNPFWEAGRKWLIV